MRRPFDHHNRALPNVHHAPNPVESVTPTPVQLSNSGPHRLDTDKAQIEPRLLSAILHLPTGLPIVGPIVGGLLGGGDNGGDGGDGGQGGDGGNGGDGGDGGGTVPSDGNDSGGGSPTPTPGDGSDNSNPPSGPSPPPPPATNPGNGNGGQNGPPPGQTTPTPTVTSSGNSVSPSPSPSSRPSQSPSAGNNNSGGGIPNGGTDLPDDKNFGAGTFNPVLSDHNDTDDSHEDSNGGDPSAGGDSPIITSPGGIGTSSVVNAGGGSSDPGSSPGIGGSNGSGGSGSGGGDSGNGNGDSPSTIGAASKISPGVIAGIAIVCSVLAVALLILFFRRRAMRKRSERRIRWWFDRSELRSDPHTNAEDDGSMAIPRPHRVGYGDIFYGLRNPRAGTQPRVSVRSSFGTTFEHQSGISPSLNEKREVAPILPTLPPTVELRGESNLSQLLISLDQSPTGAHGYSPVRESEPRRHSSQSAKSTSTSSGGSHAQYLYISNGSHTSGNPFAPTHSPMSVRPFSPSESFAFPLPPQRASSASADQSSSSSRPQSSYIQSQYNINVESPRSRPISIQLHGTIEEASETHTRSDSETFEGTLPMIMQVLSSTANPPPGLMHAHSALPESPDPFADPRPTSQSVYYTAIPDLSHDSRKSTPAGFFDEVEIIRRPFAPTLGDEMAVSVGDQVRILKLFDDGWAAAEKVDQSTPRQANSFLGSQLSWIPRPRKESAGNAIRDSSSTTGDLTWEGSGDYHSARSDITSIQSTNPRTGLIPIDCLREVGEDVSTFLSSKSVRNIPYQQAAGYTAEGRSDKRR